MSKPSWDNAPEWAQWLAQDEDGEWGWYEVRPRVGDWCWMWVDGQWAKSGTDNRADNWIDTLEQRP